MVPLSAPLRRAHSVSLPLSLFCVRCPVIFSIFPFCVDEDARAAFLSSSITHIPPLPSRSSSRTFCHQSSSLPFSPFLPYTYVDVHALYCCACRTVFLGSVCRKYLFTFSPLRTRSAWQRFFPAVVFILCLSSERIWFESIPPELDVLSLLVCLTVLVCPVESL